MNKHLTLLLFIGLAWGHAEPDTSKIDYYQIGIYAAVQDYKDLEPTYGRLTSDMWTRNALKSQPMAKNPLFKSGYKYQMSKYKAQEFGRVSGYCLATTVAIPLILGYLIPATPT